MAAAASMTTAGYSRFLQSAIRLLGQPNHYRLKNENRPIKLSGIGLRVTIAKARRHEIRPKISTTRRKSRKDATSGDRWSDTFCDANKQAKTRYCDGTGLSDNCVGRFSIRICSALSGT
jgi:hypothetical protein